MTTGMRTTEFWLGLFGAILGVVVSLGWLTPEQATGLRGAGEQLAGAIISALSILGYQISRGLAKKEVK